MSISGTHTRAPASHKRIRHHRGAPRRPTVYRKPRLPVSQASGRSAPWLRPGGNRNMCRRGWRAGGNPPACEFPAFEGCTLANRRLAVRRIWSSWGPRLVAALRDARRPQPARLAVDRQRLRASRRSRRLELAGPGARRRRAAGEAAGGQRRRRRAAHRVRRRSGARSTGSCGARA